MPPTPQFAWPLLKQRTGVDVVVKHENHTPTGAFKVRGGLVYVDRLKRERPDVKGVITATRGNHGQSLAFACARAGVACTVVVPFGNSTEKNAAMQAFGAELIEHGRDFDEARERAVEIAAERGYEYGKSFDKDLVLGVATYAYELFTAEPELDAVYVPIGLGSGVCGVIGARDALGRKAQRDRRRLGSRQHLPALARCRRVRCRPTRRSRSRTAWRCASRRPRRSPSCRPAWPAWSR